MLTLVLLVFGFIFLIKGADYLVQGSSSLAKKLRVSDLIIGLTIVALGTSTPELVATKFTTSSGVEVPKATIVNPIIKSDTRNFLAKELEIGRASCRERV